MISNAPIIVDALNYNLRLTREVEDVGVLAMLGDEERLCGSGWGSALARGTSPKFRSSASTGV
jgi:hypothetical protein